MGRHASAVDKAVSNQQQHGAGTVQRGIDDGEDCVLGWVGHHAAGLVVRRFTITKASPNVKPENKISVAREENKEKLSGVAGYSKLRRAATPEVNGLTRVSTSIHPDA